jgi:outer membrane protein assembly factor BamB
MTTLLVLIGLLVSACSLPASRPEPTPESPWQAGTPQPLFAPLTNECLGQPTAAQGTGEPGTTFPPRTDRLHYGINIFLFGVDRERVLTLTTIAGFAWIRQQIHWRDHEGNQGEYVWKPLDQIVSAARAHKLNIMLSVVRSPEWATEGGHSGMPEDPAPFAAFLHEAALRYRGRVSAYEIWNEPNLAHESGGKPGDPAIYLNLLQAAYPAIKSADPCALVVAAPMAATNNADPAVAADDIPFYEELYTLEDSAFLHAADAVAVHPGAGTFPPDARWPDDSPDISHYYFRHIERIREIMQRHNDPRQVWITEVGWTVRPAEGAPPPVTEQQQATYLVDMLWYVRQRYPWVGGVLIWNLNFSLVAPPEDEKTTYSIIQSDWSIQQAFLALQNNVPALRDVDKPPFVSEGATHSFAWNFPGRGAMRSPPLRAPDGTLYAVSAPGTIYAIAPDGRLQWSYNAPGIVSSTPARAPDGTLYVGNTAALLTAVLPGGEVDWEVRLYSPVRGSPVYADFDGHDGQVFVVTHVGEVQAFDRTGEERWSYDLEHETTPLALSSDGTLLVGDAQGTIFKLSFDGEVLWQTPTRAGLWAELTPDNRGGLYVVTVDGYVFALDQHGDIRWQTSVGAPVVAAPFFDATDTADAVADAAADAAARGNNGEELDGVVYIASRDGVLTALDASDGSRRWQFTSGSDLQAPPVRTNGENGENGGMLYLGTEDERLLAIDDTGTLRWQAHLRGTVRAQPLVAPGGTIYVATTAGRLYAFGPE